MIGPTNWKNWLTFADYLVRDTDSRSVFHFSHHWGVGDFRRFISISHIVTSQFLRYLENLILVHVDGPVITAVKRIVSYLTSTLVAGEPYCLACPVLSCLSLLQCSLPWKTSMTIYHNWLWWTTTDDSGLGLGSWSIVVRCSKYSYLGKQLKLSLWNLQNRLAVVYASSCEILQVAARCTRARGEFCCVVCLHCVVNGLGDVGSHVDRHASIGCGKIGSNCFRRIMNDQRLENLPLILETPVDRHRADIDLLYSFVD